MLLWKRVNNMGIQKDFVHETITVQIVESEEMVDIDVVLDSDYDELSEEYERICDKYDTLVDEIRDLYMGCE